MATPSYDIAGHTATLSTPQKLLNALLGLLSAALIVPFVVDIVYRAVSTVSSTGDVVMLIKQVYWFLGNNLSSFPLYFAGLAAIFVLQWLVPASREQRAFGNAVKVDMLFSVVMFAFYATVAPAYVAYLKDLATWLLPAVEVFRGADLPVFVQVLLGYLAIDFLGWLHHLVRHKVAIFWAFHAVHHAQQQLNPFSNERVHVFDWFIANAIKFIPAFLFTESLGIVLSYIVIHQFLDHLSHSNVKTNLGPLRYIFVTPQSHRVHHSVQREHFDLNYGVSLSIWDRLFGTQCHDSDVYPATGIPDTTYPYEDAPQVSTPSDVLRSFLRQQVYPFRKITNYFR